tara:strand:+ start:7837 stop:8502 length:666 start_codon:yes stop_codon:yes gene_type:complete
MDYLTYKLLSEIEVKTIVTELRNNDESWEDGKKTAGKLASKLKNNLQLNRESPLSINLREKIESKIVHDPLIKSFAIPKLIHGIMFTQAKEGMYYGNHVDNPYMTSGRSDLSFTIFLSNKNEYKGGELSIQRLNKSETIKLEAGEILIYPSTSIHSVKKIEKGVRIVCVGWIESYVKCNEIREYLFGLDAGAKGLLSKHGRSNELDLVFQSYGNLLRRLGD